MSLEDFSFSQLNAASGLSLGTRVHMKTGAMVYGMCGAGAGCSGGGGMCGAGARCAGGGGMCGAGAKCAGGGGMCGAGYQCGGS